jgi:hypothetical protein
MPSTFCSDPDLFVYYGLAGIRTLARYRRVVLQRLHHRPDELGALVASGTEALAYLALGEDTGPPAPWHRAQQNPWWGGHYVDVADPGWRRRALDRAERSLERGFAGLFLDTLDTHQLFPADREPLLALVADLRALVGGSAYLLANRGLALCHELAPLVDGFVFEGYSTTWIDGYRALPDTELLLNVRLLQELQLTGRDLYALDYAEAPALARFAHARAATHGIPCQVSNRELTRLC